VITPQQALRTVYRYVRPLETVRLSLDEALGHCLAESVRADRDLPPADRSAMDGYAVRASDLAGGKRSFRLIGEVAAGHPPEVKVRPGTCARVLTGANVPPGADTVVMQEQTAEHDGAVSIRGKVKPGSHILRRGEDARKGKVLLRRGMRLNAQRIGVCAAVGAAKVRVHRRPRIVVLCTGEELLDVSARALPHQVRDSNGPALRAALQAWGWPEVAGRTARDNLRELTAKLERASARHDVVLLSGGVSVGRYDYVREAVERVGATVRFHGLSMKPGKPLLYATLPGNRHVFGLPGNPLSAMTGLSEFAVPALRRLSGLPAKDCRPSLRMPLAHELRTKGGRTRFMLARLRQNENGLLAEPVKSQSSADLAAGGRADGTVVVHPSRPTLPAGSLVEFRPWRPLP